MANSTGWGAGLITLWGVHVLSTVLFLAGFILLLVWATKALHQAQLKTWGIAFVVVSILLCLATISVRGMPWSDTMIISSPQMKMMRMQMMDTMMGMDDDSDDAHMGHDMMGMDAMDMSMNDMTEMLSGKTGDAFDKAFIEGMIPHHQGAIDMAKEALKSAKHDEIKRMARDIISAQQSEIDMMNQWLKNWGYTQ